MNCSALLGIRAHVVSQQLAFASSKVGQEAISLAGLYVNQGKKRWLTENKPSVS